MNEYQWLIELARIGGAPTVALGILFAWFKMSSNAPDKLKAHFDEQLVALKREMREGMKELHRSIDAVKIDTATALTKIQDHEGRISRAERWIDRPAPEGGANGHDMEKETDHGEH